jgi:uncharacterized protein
MSSVAATQFLPVVATASATRDFVVVSIHDVAPATQSIVARMLSDLAKRGIHHCSLLVVPNYHHQGAFAQDREFVSWLRHLEAAGHEVVIHGYFHQRPEVGGENFFQKFVTQVYTQGEGEFYDLDYNEAFQRITKARDEFHAAGFKPRGFVAPAWLLNDAGMRAARDADLEYTTHLRDVVDLRSNEIFPARSLVYSVRNGWRRTVSLAWNATLSRVLKNQPLMRLSIHPPDYSHSVIWAQILRFSEEMGRARTPTTYQDWIGDQRIKRAL